MGTPEAPGPWPLALAVVWAPLRALATGEVTSCYISGVTTRLQAPHPPPVIAEFYYVPWPPAGPTPPSPGCLSIPVNPPPAPWGAWIPLGGASEVICL